MYKLVDIHNTAIDVYMYKNGCKVTFFSPKIKIIWYFFS